MKLHCFAHSGHSYKIASYLNLANIDWAPVFIDFFKGETRRQDYLAKNPMGEAPYFEDDDVKLSQSGVILDYLVEKTGHFAPIDRRENLRWMLWDNHKGSSAFGTARFMVNFLSETHRNADVNAFLLGRVKASLKVLETQMTGRDFVEGNRPTTADLALSSYLFYPEEFGFSRQEWPAIDQWLSRIENLPNWAHPYDLMPADQDMINASPAAKHWHK